MAQRGVGVKEELDLAIWVRTERATERSARMKALAREDRIDPGETNRSTRIVSHVLLAGRRPAVQATSPSCAPPHASFP